MSGKCGSCKHWGPALNSDRVGACSRWKTGYNFTVDDIGAGEVVVEDDEGWGMYSDKEFGCTLFEAGDER